MAAWPEADLNRPHAAGARARGVIDVYGDEEPGETGRARRAEAEALLKYLAKNPGPSGA
ncbi:hypothetical protein [Streptomyces sp. BE133]|uniref:hypothetical protein n=1 Tax=Streptomyces sp. BE133 TaxID=3002523 RepID=UPI002E775CF5|nr:hypothetical protein [Streptomyces sp. BE133]MEE1809564.1 hypothetical protein [Streptomyces sp. BE133]